MRASLTLMLLVLATSAAFAKRGAAPASPAARLIGTWSIDPNDEGGIRAFGRCSMEFKSNGQLVYSVPEGKMLLTYRVEGDFIISDQPSHPSQQRSRFAFAADGSLTLDFDGQRARFLKQATAAP